MIPEFISLVITQVSDLENTFHSGLNCLSFSMALRDFERNMCSKLQ